MIVSVDYEAGNLGSVKNTLDKLGLQNTISNRPEVIRDASVIILPGVGAAGTGMASLKENGLDQTLRDEVKKGKPILGICLGMQLLFEKSEEGNVICLEIVKGRVKRFPDTVKVPQIGWNKVSYENLNIKDQKCKSKINILFKNIINNSYFYFVNSYYCVPRDESIIIGKTDYGDEFASIIVKDNIIAVQFHPEKSGSRGFQLLKNIFGYFQERRTLC